MKVIRMYEAGMVEYLAKLLAHEKLTIDEMKALKEVIEILKRRLKCMK